VDFCVRKAMSGACRIRSRSPRGSASGDVQQFIDAVNLRYETLHRAFEEQFWGTKMNLSGDFSASRLAQTKVELETFLRGSDGSSERAKKLLDSAALTADQAKVLNIIQRTFSCYSMSDKVAAARQAITEHESKLEELRNQMQLGFIDGQNQFCPASSVQLRTQMATSDDEALRKASYLGLRSIGTFICGNGFLDIVKQRNKFARDLGYKDFYDYKVTTAEGFNKDTLFGMLDGLEQRTRPLLHQARRLLEHTKGPTATEPWNSSHAIAGDVKKQMDPYFPFSRAVEMWGRSFAKMGISYRGATMTLDLLDRPKKYSNGFCHWPQPAWIKSDGAWQPSVANFTSLADPKAVGSGLTGLTTLMHEAGHAAHFANINQRSPLFSQERAPTSVAYAETQSMFLDSLVSDGAWRGRYARTVDGAPMPADVHEKFLRSMKPYKVFELRSMLAVPYFEKRLYELDDQDVTAEGLERLAAEVESLVQGGPAGRPLLSVPHILSDESSCYYHGYVLAEMAVWQTRSHFLQKYGSIVDNPRIGDDLKQTYWECGNSRPFLETVQDLTGKTLSGDDWVAELQTDLEEYVSSELRALAVASAEPDPASEGLDVDLDMHMRLVDGDTVLADSQEAGFVSACRKFAAKL